MDLMEFLYRVMEELSNVDELRQIWKETGRELGDFKAYRTHPEELGEAYDKMKGIKNKPDFIEIYNQVSDVICKLENV